MPDRETVIKGLQNLRDAIETDYIHEADQAVGTIDNALSLLKEQPEIVRCKDCKYGEPMCKPWEDIVCTQIRATHCPDWFCADGERR